MRTLLQAFEESMQRRNFSPQTISGRLWILNKFLSFVGELDSCDLHEKHLTQYLLFLQSQPQLHKRTVYERFLQVRGWLRWAVSQELLVHDPTRGFQEKAPPQGLRTVPTREQMEQLLQAPLKTKVDKRDRVLLELIYGTGLRRGEVCALDLLDFDRASQGLWVRRGKGGKDRLNPVGDHLLAVLEDYFASIRPHFKPRANAVFITCRGTRLTPQSLFLAVQRNAKKNGLPTICTHSLRHAFATHLLEGGATLLEVKLLLGHRRLESTQRYTKVLPLELIHEYQRTHPRAYRRAR